MPTYFSPVAFFIALREVLEAGIIIAVLLGFIAQIVPSSDIPSSGNQIRLDDSNSATGSRSPYLHPIDDDDSRSIASRSSSTLRVDEIPLQDAQLPVEPPSWLEDEGVVRKMKLQIWSGALLGGLTAAVIGGVFLYMFYTYTTDLWADAELLWEGGFCAVAAALILVMGLAFLRLPHAQTKWRLKLLAAYKSTSDSSASNSGKWILFGLPFITVLREGLEAVVFIGGIGLSETGSQIAGGSIAGAIVGCLLAYLLFSSSVPLPLPLFTTLSTLLLFLIGSGLASRSAFSLERQQYVSAVGQAAAESGNGPGSYPLHFNIWKLGYGDPEPGAEGTNGWWQLANSLVGWNNIGTVWTVGTYIAYWLIIILTLIRLKYKEGRTTIFGRRSVRGWERERKRRREAGEGEVEGGEEERSLLSPSLRN